MIDMRKIIQMDGYVLGIPTKKGCNRKSSGEVYYIGYGLGRKKNELFEEIVGKLDDKIKEV